MGRFSTLTRIRQEVETTSAHLLMSGNFALAAKSSTTGFNAMTGGGGSAFMFDNRIPEYQEQYRHFRGWVYTAIKTIANRIAGQPFAMGKRLNGRKPTKGSKLYQPAELALVPSHVKSHLMATQVEVIHEHEFLTALRSPNIHTTAWSLMFNTAASLNLTGRSFWWMTTNEEGKMEITFVPSHWVSFIFSESGKFVGYEIKRPNSPMAPIPVGPLEMLYFPMPNPGEPRETISPLQTQATAVAVDESIQMAQFRAFKNGIFPGVMIRVGKIDGMAGMPGEVPLLDAAQRRDLVAAVQALYGGVLNYGDPLILDALIEGVEKLTHTPQEMDFMESGEAVKKRIFQAFGVNPILTGQTDGANRAQAAVADGIFCNNVINPLTDLIGQVVSAWLVRTGKKSDENTLFWIEQARPNDDELKLKEWLGAMTNLVATPDEYRMNVLGLEAMTEEDKKQMKELMALRIMGKPNASGNTSGGTARTPSSD